jgi:hypothetical protein
MDKRTVFLIEAIKTKRAELELLLDKPTKGVSTAELSYQLVREQWLNWIVYMQQEINNFRNGEFE